MSKTKDVVIDHMNTKAAQVVKFIGDKLIDELFELDRDISYEPEPEFGGFEADYSVQINMEPWNIDIDCTVTWPYHKAPSIEVTLYGCEEIHKNRFKKLDRIQEAVQEYLDENLDTDSLLSNMQDKLRDASMDEWESHGFRDAADYYHYRYG